MAEQLILEFAGVTADDYWAVNEALGLSPDRSEGWPDGIITHSAGTTDEGGLVVTEIWESQEAQGAFMNGRLGPALGQVGLPEPVRVTWLDVIAERRI